MEVVYRRRGGNGDPNALTGAPEGAGSANRRTCQATHMVHLLELAPAWHKRDSGAQRAVVAADQCSVGDSSRPYSVPLSFSTSSPALPLLSSDDPACLLANLVNNLLAQNNRVLWLYAER
jgi:hypothetical protein